MIKAFAEDQRCEVNTLYRGVARIFQKGWGGGGHTASHPGYLHGPLQMFGPENGVCNYVALENINDMLILGIRVFSPPEL